MIKLEIKDKAKNLYMLQDKSCGYYNLHLKFYDIEEEPSIGDSICMNEQLLNSKYEGYSTFYTFGSIDNKYGKSNITIDDIDVIRLVIKNKEIYLKRLYG